MAAGAACQWPVHYFTFPIFSYAAARWAGDLFLLCPTFFVAAAMGARGSHPIFSERCRAVNGWETAGLCPVDFFYGRIFLVTHGRAVGPLIFFWRPTIFFSLARTVQRATVVSVVNLHAPNSPEPSMVDFIGRLAEFSGVI